MELLYVYRAWIPSQDDMGLANPAGKVRIGRLHTPLRPLWRTVRHAECLTIFSFTVKASDNSVNSEKLEGHAGNPTRSLKGSERKTEVLFTRLS
ncbi:jg2374 [Pararge aegeria aegeria]|uniref:Jg2374 protein n=1 Tax=Pararge aegeria aegeria TaxID=348720 RepID=A0A8S4R545_9NEOP|nr:jg2374 [Pararge aegeria aegeria]